ncbi:type I-E CRISPR-associated protein Cse1/CasA [Mixta theicola]|uniref:Type I-E CRISPR-associated protein Cse1/CasA n=1 Tax=Mixta theicola TaxID=1458355 RepID=A0A2K1Q990_9GAMM|nr:type I-E CRISPR-associated protein Cse1/CasA [Mixta theicola]PNS11601.1 type I-E CRISPR-associated protein Cse1/CasA [Mixta theicola]GLR08693.1 type I-E CRISPR-associated protein Cse1/CasA [Mixta theicola]
MDLTQEKWLPVVLHDGKKTRISLSELLNDNIIDVAWPRADFQGASWQMLIGVLQCAVAPEEEDDWKDTWDDGIDAEEWALGLQRISCALRFGAEKPSFLQSFEPLESEASPISGLLIDAPGGNTLKFNKDHFVKRGRTERICPHCAVMALFAMQTNSPAGGAGYRVSMRGGGPLTTLAVPLEEEKFPLWKKLWLNVLPQDEALTPVQFPSVFPWLAPTKTSEKAGNVVTPENAHPLQAYWGMPRRIELDFNHTVSGICDLCGEPHEQLLLQIRVKNYGVQYEGWLHPLSPYRQALKDLSAPWLALKGQPGGLSYKDWLGLSLERADKFNKNQPAKVVRAASRRINGGMWCFAWDMDNAKARCWYQHRIPLIPADSDLLQIAVYHVLQLATETLPLLRNALKSAKFEHPKEAKFDSSMVDIAFWQETEPAFRKLLDILIADPPRKNAPARRALRQWDSELHTYALRVFDRDALTDPDSPTDILLRQIEARRTLDGSYRKLKARKEVLALAEEEKETKRA